MVFSFKRYLNFCRDVLSYKGKPLHEKAKVNFKVYDVTTGTLNCITHIVQISRSKSNQKTKFDQLIEHHVKN